MLSLDTKGASEELSASFGIVLQILRESGAECGTAIQKILTACPPERYSSNEISKMTQISVAEIIQLIAEQPSIFSLKIILTIAVAFIVGVIIGILYRKLIKRKITNNQKL